MKEPVDRAGESRLQLGAKVRMRLQLGVVLDRRERPGSRSADRSATAMPIGGGTTARRSRDDSPQAPISGAFPVSWPGTAPPSLSHVLESKELRTRTRTFRKGDKVVYPRHGVAVVEGLVEMETLGERRTCLKLRLVHGNLTITVPVDSARQIGVRDVACREDAEAVFELLRLEEGVLPTLWNQRYKTNLTKLVSGDIHQGAEVVRDLSLRQRRTGLSSAEKDMLFKARQILISELSCTFASTEESAQAMLDGVLEGSG